jgi:hypothetical protein
MNGTTMANAGLLALLATSLAATPSCQRCRDEIEPHPTVTANPSAVQMISASQIYQFIAAPIPYPPGSGPEVSLATFDGAGGDLFVLFLCRLKRAAPHDKGTYALADLCDLVRLQLHTLTPAGPRDAFYTFAAPAGTLTVVSFAEPISAPRANDIEDHEAVLDVPQTTLRADAGGDPSAPATLAFAVAGLNYKLRIVWSPVRVCGID